MSRAQLERRIIPVAENALARSSTVSLLDVLNGIGWLPGNDIDRWRQGRVDHLEQLLSAAPAKIATVREIFGDWVAAKGLTPSEGLYVTTSRDRRPLRFTADDDHAVDLLYRTHWSSANLTEAKRERLTKPPDLLVISPLKEWTCDGCGGTGDLLIMEGDGALCLTCADMDHLVYLPAGDAALTRRSKKESGLSAVVVRWSRSRKRYERQGLLVEESALERAEEQCLADEEMRSRRRDRDRIRRADEDVEFQARMATAIVGLFPGCPAERAEAVARHAGLRGSGRVGRTAAGRALDENAVTLAVAASVRHEDTDYDELLMTGADRQDARTRVRSRIDEVLEGWRS
jgi:hypothetical protein